MYTPDRYRADDREFIYQFIRENNFGLLLNGGDAGLEATHLPFMLDTSRGEQGVLIAHIARANLQWKYFQTEPEVLAVFMGPHAYISPSWYVEPEGVPTWNYVAVHAIGRVRLVDDIEVVKKSLVDMTAYHESFVRHEKAPWQVDSLKTEYYTGRLKAIVGFEIEITKLTGKRKLSQNRSQEDRLSIIRGLNACGDANSMAIAQYMQEEL